MAEWPTIWMAHHPDLGHGMIGRERSGAVELVRVMHPDEYLQRADHWPTEKYLPLHVVRERLQALWDGETALYGRALVDNDRDGIVSHGAACEALGAALASLDTDQEAGND